MHIVVKYFIYLYIFFTFIWCTYIHTQFAPESWTYFFLQLNNCIKLTHPSTYNPSLMTMSEHADTQLWSFMMTEFLVSCLHIFPCLSLIQAWSRTVTDFTRNRDKKHRLWTSVERCIIRAMRRGKKQCYQKRASLANLTEASYGKLWSYGSSCVCLAVITVLWLCSYEIQ